MKVLFGRDAIRTVEDLPEEEILDSEEECEKMVSVAKQFDSVRQLMQPLWEKNTKKAQEVMKRK